LLHTDIQQQLHTIYSKSHTLIYTNSYTQRDKATGTLKYSYITNCYTFKLNADIHPHLRTDILYTHRYTVLILQLVQKDTQPQLATHMYKLIKNTGIQVLYSIIVIHSPGYTLTYSHNNARR
jgi:hypothetical protein